MADADGATDIRDLDRVEQGMDEIAPVRPFSRSPAHLAGGAPSCCRPFIPNACPLFLLHPCVPEQRRLRRCGWLPGPPAGRCRGPALLLPHDSHVRLSLCRGLSLRERHSRHPGEAAGNNRDACCHHCACGSTPPVLHSAALSCLRGPLRSCSLARCTLTAGESRLTSAHASGLQTWAEARHAPAHVHSHLAPARAFDVELLYIAQYHRMPIAEVPVNWQEIDGPCRAGRAG